MSEKKDKDQGSEASLPAQLEPQVLACGEHPITTQQIDSDALKVLQKLSKAGFSGYLVGGGVRDLYLGKKPKDFDISTNARPGQIRKLFPNSNVIGRRFRLVQVFFGRNKTIEVSTLRSLSEHDLDGPEAVLAPNNTFGTLSEDARRRDLTINSLFYEIENGTIIDYVSGSDDLNNAIIRIVGEPEKRIRRDPVRMMRAIRHAARNDFSIEENTWNSICENNQNLLLCPPSRLRDEFLKDLYGGSSAPWFELASQSGIFFALFPFYQELLTESTTAVDVKAELSRIFATIDRVNAHAQANGYHRQKDFFYFALVLIPWAKQRFNLLSEARKGSTLYQLGKEIRNQLDSGIGIGLNLRRSLRQEVVNLLINLTQLSQGRQKNSWPRRLTKKSYFQRAKLFYLFYQEIDEGKPLNLNQFITTKKAPASPLPEPKKEKPANSGKPAFAPNTPGGVFGFTR